MGFFSAPLSGLMYVFKEINKRADKEMNDDEAIKAELVALHSTLEAGGITEEAFEAKELELVTRLSEIEERKAGPPLRRLPIGEHHRKAALRHVSRPTAAQAARAKAVALEPPAPPPTLPQPPPPAPPLRASERPAPPLRASERPARPSFAPTSATESLQARSPARAGH